MVSTHSDKAPNYYTPRTFSRDHNNQNRPSPAREPQGKNKYDVVYGVAKTPQVYQGNNERGQNYNLYPIPGEDIVSQRRRDYENKNVDKYEHNVNVQTVQENKDAKGNIHTHKHPGGRGSVHKKDQRESSREFVDHVQRQRELKTTHQVGRELEQISKVLPTAVVEEPHVEHKEVGTYFHVLVLKLHLTHWGRDKMAALSQTALSNAFSWMKMLEFRLRFQWSLFLRVQLTIIQHWLR